MSDDLKSAVDTVHRAFEEFKATNDARLAEIEKRGADPVTIDKLGKIEADIARYEGINQKLTLAEQRTKDADDRVSAIEAKLNRPGGGTPRDNALDRKAYWNDWARGTIGAFSLGVGNLPDEQRKAIDRATTEAKALTVGNDTTGGYLAPVEMVQEIIKGVTEVSPIRSIARVRQTASKAINLPKRTGQFAAVWVAEAGTRAETTGLTWGMEEINAHEMYALVDISHANLEDSAYDLEAELRMEAMEQFAVAEGLAAVSGSGVGRPEGYMTSSAVSTTNSGSAATIADADGQANGLMSLFHALKTAYTRNAVWTLNRTTLGSVRKLKDAQKNYVWMPGLANGIPNTILGSPYVEMPDMPSEGAGLKPIAFGDFRRAYVLVDRIAMNMLRDPYTQADSGMIRFRFYRRTGGKVVLGEAIRTLTCAA